MTVQANDPTSSRTADEILLDADNPALLVCSVFEDQRPLKGVAGALDWRLKGFLSRFVMSGRITGANEEYVYVPIKHESHVKHLMLVGLGAHGAKSDKHGDQVLTGLAKRVADLKFKRVAVSRSSFPFLDENRIKRALKGVEVEFTQ